ncbi:MAG: tRNA (N6-isopentenyl adenosine(37)-C2)-methylthiotransferase MiaB [Acidobacteria bacterium]|nr:tRNA (N6-isopentenyl adenosine(37)-C2)-methylthiotransferase MiaB [Acidobacteriota bacterium]
MPKKYFIETFGCQMNVHDSERLAGLLDQAGYEAADGVGQADLVVINTCSVRERAEDRLYTELGQVTDNDAGRRPIVAVTGCVAQQEGGALLMRGRGVDLVVGTHALSRLPDMVDELEQSSPERVDINPYDNVSFPFGLTRRSDPVKASVTIIEGCNDFCSFCVVPYTRGHERMRPAGEIVDEVRLAASQGHKEIHLLGQIVNHYAAPDRSDCDFAALLELVDAVPGVERIRFASPHPRHVTERMITAMAQLPTVCRHLHLPVQSGSTEVLTRMRRRHTRDEYLSLVDRIRVAMPDIALSTDVIVGFPGETADDFKDTLSLVRAVGYHSMFSFKYSERPNTLATQRLPDDVPAADKTSRIVALQDEQKVIQEALHRAQIGREVQVLVDSTSRRRTSELAGRTTGNTVVNFEAPQSLLGHLVPVRITDSGTFSLRGTLAESGD